MEVLFFHSRLDLVSDCETHISDVSFCFACVCLSECETNIMFLLLQNKVFCRMRVEAKFVLTFSIGPMRSQIMSCGKKRSKNSLFFAVSFIEMIKAISIELPYTT